MVENPKEAKRKLRADGWQERTGKGDHRNFTKNGGPSVVTLDMGTREIPIGALRGIYRAAGWTW